jgi:hypothetical protein
VYAKNDVDGEETWSRSTLKRPSLELRWGADPFNADLSYDRNQTEISGTGFSKVTTIVESYQGRLGWKPADLPSLDVFLGRTNDYDVDRDFRDSTVDQISWTSFYNALRTLQVSYRGSYTESKDNLNGVDVKALGNDLWTQYTDRWLHDRASVQASYEISRSDTDIDVSGKGGAVTLQVPPFEGLSLLTDTPQLGALDPNPFLVDGDVFASSGVNIGVPPVGGDMRPRNIGLNFFAEAEVNTIWVWIDRNQLPASFVNFYQWSVYTSSDNLTWTLRAQVGSVPLVEFRTRFEITFPNVRAQFVKVVVNPLTATVAASDPTFPNPDSIDVTEIQAFITQPITAQSRSTSLTSTTQIINTTANVIILRKPQLYYDFSYTKTRSDTSVGPPVSSWNLANALNVSQPLSRIFTASGRAARLDMSFENGTGTTYQYTASLDAYPVATLSHNLSYTLIKDEKPEGTTTTNGVSLSNTAQLYTGISAYLNLGYSTQSNFNGTDIKSASLNGVISVVPNRVISVTLGQGFSESRISGLGPEEVTSRSRSTDLSASFSPYQSLYAYGSWSWQKTDVRSDLLQNYNVNWIPFQGGDLVFNFSYNESLSQADDSKSRALNSTVRWNLSPGSFLSFYYSIIKSDFGNAAAGFDPTQPRISFTQDETRYTVEYRQNF